MSIYVLQRQIFSPKQWGVPARLPPSSLARENLTRTFNCTPGGLRQILNFLGASRDELEDSAIEEILRFYSKDKHRLKPFVDDSNEKQSFASVALRRAVNRWSMEAFEQLATVATRHLHARI